MPLDPCDTHDCMGCSATHLDISEASADRSTPGKSVESWTAKRTLSRPARTGDGVVVCTVRDTGPQWPDVRVRFRTGRM